MELRVTLCQSLLSLRRGLESGRYDAPSIKWINEVYLTGLFLFYAFDAESDAVFDQHVARYCAHVDADFGVYQAGSSDLSLVFEPLRLIPVGTEPSGFGGQELIRGIATNVKAQVLAKLRESIFKASLLDPEQTGDSQDEKNYILGMAEMTAMRIGELFATPCGVGALELSETANYIRVAMKFVSDLEKGFQEAALAAA